MKRKSSLTRFCLLAVLLNGLIACSPETDSGNATELASDTVTTASPPTTSTTKPTTTSTTEPEPTTTTINDETAVLKLHAIYMTELSKIDERVDDPDKLNQRFAEVTVDPILSRATESRQKRLLRNEFIVGPGYESNVVDVELGEGSATVTDCSLGRSQLVDSNDNVLVDVDESYQIRQTIFTKISDGTWKLQDVYGAGDIPCDP